MLGTMDFGIADDGQLPLKEEPSTASRADITPVVV
jgi:hypothetical protein